MITLHKVKIFIDIFKNTKVFDYEMLDDLQHEDDILIYGTKYYYAMFNIIRGIFKLLEGVIIILSLGFIIPRYNLGLCRVFRKFEKYIKEKNLL